MKSFPALSKGFEIETELTIHALELSMPIAERIATYNQRPDRIHQQVEHSTGWSSHPARDHTANQERATIGVLWSDRRHPHLHCHRIGCSARCNISRDRPGPTPPDRCTSAALVLMGVQSITAGIILDNVTTSRREAKRIAYLQIPPAVDDERYVIEMTGQSATCRELEMSDSNRKQSLVIPAPPSTVTCGIPFASDRTYLLIPQAGR